MSLFCIPADTRQSVLKCIYPSLSVMKRDFVALAHQAGSSHSENGLPCCLELTRHCADAHPCTQTSQNRLLLIIIQGRRPAEAFS
ncbi:hypothetical protein LA635_p1027 (plasmid) [Erwinia amylovora LA635]|uniref:Uncharacterized protein n=1 Tax=Erwinia amylovora TaxID=552 RepID=A0A0P0ZH06_ERWAM|nr:hypothetical protein LA635_p1027 [Erwinia amylovora LA635]CDK23804.1 hypothetical protein LA636_p1026 [Erwinia amylovora LA636]CDK23854.1 hypothetical protein LA637_p1027 [Erwinia amylovora LA637]CDM08152.1 hypothetical protein EAMY692_p20026 [Erwinia amylovora]